MSLWGLQVNSQLLEAFAAFPVHGQLTSRAAAHAPGAIAALGYVPSKAASIVAVVVYSLCGLALLFRVCRNRDFWGLCLPIGSFAMAVGFVVRYLIASPSRQTQGPFIVEEILTSCSPAAFLAFNYIVYGRILRYSVGKRHSIILPNRIALFFILSDVITFIVQAAGASLFARAETVKTGQRIFQVGVILQSVSYYIYFAMFLYTWRSIRKEGLVTGRESWWKVFRLLTVSSAFIIVRTIFRIVQSAYGRGSIIRDHEVYLYLLDTLPLFLAIIVYICYWPGDYMRGDSIAHPADQYKLTGLDISSNVQSV